MKIISSTNPRIKQVVRLRERKERNETGLTLVEGVREVSRAIEAGVPIKEIYYCPEVLRKYAKENQIEKILKTSSDVFELTPELSQKISFGDRNEGLVALAKTQIRGLDHLLSPRDGLYVVMENIEKPGNCGAVLRTCDAAGVTALFIADERMDTFNPNVIRASLGTVFCLPVIQEKPQKIFQFLREKKIRILATSPQAKKIYFSEDFRQAVAFVVGSEQGGLSDFWMQHSDEQIKIPMSGKADSLNVANSVSVLVFEAVRQRTAAAVK
jgi:RNA methyltransferase, TrmH family